VRLLVVNRIMLLEYWLTLDCARVVLFQSRTVRLEYWLTQDCAMVVLF